MKRVTVLMGGPSAEREVSLASGASCAAALTEAGYQVATIDVTRDLKAMFAAIDVQKPDVLFIALHGRWVEDGNIQGALNFLGIPYTHSGVMASAIAMDKPMAKRVFAAAGLRCPEGVILDKAAVLRGDVMARPYVVKPANEGSSVGVCIARVGDNDPFGDAPWTDDTPLLVERFIPGRELTVGVMGGKDGDRAMAVTELRPHAGFYDYANKYTDGKTVHLCPAPVSDEVAAEAMRMAIVAHQALGCRGISRCDFRYDDTAGGGIDQLYLLEINTQPGMTALSLVPEQARYLGISYPQLVSWMVENAACDH
jgi:D-alanine-D-alanine ligase